ncbi:hypothetical protein KR084_008200 [Drosophila pseudotakahashii]|nr:hypothetical protein KR084_008200 [Drosophila pseudotakahashii]
MEKINIDVWIRILEFLPISDQLSVAQVNKRLLGFVKYQWNRQKSLALSRLDLELLDRNEELMDECLTCWAGTLNRLEMPSARQDLLKKWRVYDFSHLQVLNCRMDENLQNADDEILLLTQLFPHLTSLTLESSTTGRFLCRWSGLKELTLDRCKNLNTITFDEFLSNIKLTKLSILFYRNGMNLHDQQIDITRCSTLEELIIDEVSLESEILNNLLHLPHLRRLVFRKDSFYWYLLLWEISQHPHRVRSVVTNLDGPWRYKIMEDCILKIINLRRLVLLKEDIDFRLLQGICRKMPNLEELHLVEMQRLPSPTDFWNSIRFCPTLRILNLSSNVFIDEWSNVNNWRLPDVLRYRSSPLTLHLHDVVLRNVGPGNIPPSLKCPNLIISFEPIVLNISSSQFTEILFNPESA